MNLASTSFTALGTTAALFVVEPSTLAPARTLLEEELEAIDLACSRFRSDSELSQVNAAAGRPIRVSPLFLEALGVALRAARLSDGVVDPTVGGALRAIGYDRDFASMAGPPRAASGAVVPGWRTVRVDRSAATVRVAAGVELDLGATAKALAADRAASRIERKLGTGVLVNLGGDISLAGAPPPGGWRIRIAEDHRDHASCGETVSINAGGLATSSTTVRHWSSRDGGMHHIVDPRQGTSAEVVWRTASVAAASCVDANIATTAAIIRGREAAAWLGGLGLPSRLVGSDGQIIRLGGWPRSSV